MKPNKTMIELLSATWGVDPDGDIVDMTDYRPVAIICDVIRPTTKSRFIAAAPAMARLLEQAGELLETSNEPSVQQWRESVAALVAHIEGSEK